MNQSPPFVSIILPVFNEEQYLEECLTKLRKVKYPKDRYEIITVDNGSTDNSLSIAKRFADQALVLIDVNVGAVRNFGAQHAKGSILAFLDSDCLVTETWIKSGIKLLKDNPNNVYGGNCRLRNSPAWIEKYWLLDNPDAPHRQKDLLGSCIFIYKQHFIDVSGFNEKVSSGEDTELSVKLRKKNHKVIIDRSIGVVHLGNATTISKYLKRQIWHSENYIRAIKSSIADATFWLVLMYTSSIFGLLLFGFGVAIYLPVIAIGIFVPPMIQSIKRISRAQFKIESLYDLIRIYLIDHLYLLGRSAGLIKGIVNLIKAIPSTWRYLINH